MPAATYLALVLLHRHDHRHVFGFAEEHSGYRDEDVARNELCIHSAAKTSVWSYIRKLSLHKHSINREGEWHIFATAKKKMLQKSWDNQKTEYLPTHV